MRPVLHVWGAVVLALCLVWLGAQSQRMTQGTRTASPGRILAVHTQFVPGGPLAAGPPQELGSASTLPIALGWSDRNLWVHLRVRIDRDDQPVWLELVPARLTLARLHLKGADGQWQHQDSGATVPVSQRPVGKTQLMFAMPLAAHTEHDVWLEIRSRSPLNLTFAFHASVDDLPSATFDALVNLMVLGALGVLGVLALTVGVLGQQPIYLVLGVRVVAIGVWLTHQFGIMALLLPVEWVAPVALNILWVAQCALLAVLVSVWLFLRKCHLPPWAHWVYVGFGAMMVGTALLDALGVVSHVFVGPFLIACNLALHVFNVAIAVVLVWQGSALASVVLVGSLVSALLYSPRYLTLMGLATDDVVGEVVTPLPTLITLLLFFTVTVIQTVRELRMAQQSALEARQLQVLELERRVAERTQQLEASKNQAQQLNASKSVFLAKVSHELRTPMHAVLGYMDLAMREGLAPKPKGMLQVARNAGRQLLIQIGDLLDFSRLEREQLRLVPEVMSLSVLQTAVTEVALLQARERGNRFDQTFDPTTPGWVVADPRRIEQVLMILLVNAFRYTRAGHVELRTTVQAKLPASHAGEKGRVCMRFEVADTGRGISPQALARICETFERGDAVDGDGMGLGLSIAQQLLGLMGSRLEVRSQWHAGSCFAFELTLPVADPSSGGHVLEATAFAGYRGAQRTVLVLDDVRVNREYLLTLLTSSGFAVELAETVPQALEKVSQLEQAARRVDVCVVDQVLRYAETGWMFVAQLRSHVAWDSSLCPVLMLSATESTPPPDWDTDPGVDQFLLKPVDPNRLLVAIADLLQLDWYGVQSTAALAEATDGTLVQPGEAGAGAGAMAPTPAAADPGPRPDDWARLQRIAQDGDLTALEAWVNHYPSAAQRLENLILALDFDGISRYASAHVHAPR